ncbi:unnamed protein product [Rhizoctonia solani]|uniref:Uncharacterized protein n=1 Tax=Rhizoctonia solani TaxID=456999 RepID=A0A8H2Y1S3_9AGAM|nr:unnamed protein product [Rhizoctonia solani]
MLPTTGEFTHPTTLSEQPSLLPTGQIKFFREALLTEWKHPSFVEELNSKNPIELDAYNRIDDEVYSAPDTFIITSSRATQEFNTMIAQVPEGCMFTMTLDCFHGGKMHASCISIDRLQWSV